MKFYLKSDFVIVITILFAAIFLLFKGNTTQSKKGIQPTKIPILVEVSIDPTASPTAILSPTDTPFPTKKLSKKRYSIALYGDSLIDTMSDHTDLLNIYLSRMYPGITFTIYNYGIGAQNVEAGLARFESAFSNRNRTYPPITEIKPDVIVVGSFSYNPFSPHDKEKHKALLSQIVSKSKQTRADVYMLQEIAPLGATFGDGPTGVNWTDAVSIEHSNHIIELLGNVPVIAAEQHVKVIDVYSRSKAAGSEYGTSGLVSTSDGIHPSEAGHALTFRTMLSTIIFK